MRIPSLRRRVIRGRAVGYVSLWDRVSKKRRDVWLGDFATCSERYARALAEWEARGRRVVFDPPRAAAKVGGFTITQLCADYWDWAEGAYDAKHLHGLRSIVRVLLEHYGSTPVGVFGPNSLRSLREAMVRKGWARSTCNRGAQRVVAIFKWAVGRELVEATVWQALKSLEPLKAGRTAAPETDPVLPADPAAVEAARRFVAPQVRAMIDLQCLTGMRPGEVVGMRLCEIDMAGAVWYFRPAHHKTAHRGRRRVIALGPKAQAVLARFMRRSTTAYLFSPAEAMRRGMAIRSCCRSTPLSCGNVPGSNRAQAPRRRPGERYDVGSYRRAIAYACARAGVEAWHPNQLRHSFATEVRRAYGLEAAAQALGHSSAALTDAVYAERDVGVISRIAEAF